MGDNNTSTSRGTDPAHAVPDWAVGEWGLWEIPDFTDRAAILVAGYIVAELGVGEWEVEGLAIALTVDQVLDAEDATGYRFVVTTSARRWPLADRHRSSVRARLAALRPGRASYACGGAGE